MAKVLGLCFGFVFTILFCSSLAWNIDSRCENSNNITSDDSLPQYAIELETVPERRWLPIAQAYHQKMKNVLNFIEGIFGRMFFKITLYLMKFLITTIPPEYVSEMRGIAMGANMSLESVVLMNVFYEFSTLCTSIIVRHGITGEIYHARNLDFGISPGWNASTHRWILTDLLRNIVVDVNWMKEKQQIAKSTHFVGYVGFLTAISRGSFTYSINQRFSEVPSIWNLILHALGARSNFIGFVSRDLVLKQSSYKVAVKTLSTVRLIAPCYITLGSAKNEATLLVRGRNSVESIENLGVDSEKWYIYVTNYDKGSELSHVDDRDETCEECLGRIPHNNKGAVVGNLSASLLNVLSTKPVLNKLSIYTTLMHLQTNISNSYFRYCEDPCPLI